MDSTRRDSFCALGLLAALRRSPILSGLSASASAVAGDAARRRLIEVGPDRRVRTLAEAARVAADGDIVEVAPGDYRGDVAVWAQRDLIVRGAGRGATLIADGASAEGKAIFVMRGDRARVENLAFRGASVRDRNGAGIRLEKGRLEIVACRFEGNESGVLTNNDDGIELTIDRCSFVENGAGDGQSHNLYAGAIGRLTVTASYFARARVGHLLKSRAGENRIAWCRFSGEDSTGSYEIEFPNGGIAEIIGCLIQQGRRSQNPTMIAFGAEGYRRPGNELRITFSTIVNERPPGGVFVRVLPGPVRVEALDNLLVGRGNLDVRADAVLVRNAVGRHKDFADPKRMDFRLKRSSSLVGAAGIVGQLGPDRSYPEKEYVHPADSRPLPALSALPPLSPGAFQRLAE